MRTVKFYFDPISPYVYFTFHQLPQLISKHNINLRCVPVLFAGLLNEHGQLGPAEIVAKRRYTFQDCLRLADHAKVPFSYPPAHPFNPLLPSRMATAIEDNKSRFQFSAKVTEACWAKGKDITDANLLIGIANHIGLNGPELHVKSSSEAVKKMLKDHTNEAIANGVFGVPSLYVQDTKELFWGSDRLHLLDAHLGGGLNTDFVKLEKMLSHPRGADRKSQK